MIIKGGSRAAPGQLAWHLQRLDTNDKIEILELQSPAPNLAEAFRDWQTLVEGTRGFKGLYHANIDPAKDYTMTREQWQHAVEVLEKELKLEGQPRAVVMHEKHGREHIHVVWARTDIDAMTLRSDSQNYLAHERASQRLELEFGHEQVPGKHAKRDREKQPEFPRAEANQAEWQQGERTGIDLTARKDQITALRQASDSGQAFKTALEENGYILAKGDRRDFVIVDQAGSIHSLGRQIRDMKAAELRAFMKDIDRETLPTAEEAIALQQQRRAETIGSKYAAPEPPPEQQQPEHSHQQEPSHYDYIDHQEQLRRQHQAPERPQPPDESQERPPKSRRSEPPRHYPYQPNVDGLGAIIEVAVTPLTEALRAILDYRSAKKGEFPDDEARRRKEAASAQTPRRYPKQPDIDGLGAIIEVAVTPLTEALRAILGDKPGEERRRLDEQEKRPKQPNVDGLGAIIEVAVTPLTEALRAILADRPDKKRERPDTIQQDQPEARARREQRELSTALARFFGAIRDFFLPDRAVRRDAEPSPQDEELARHQRQEHEEQLRRQQRQPEPQHERKEPRHPQEKEQRENHHQQQQKEQPEQPEQRPEAQEPQGQEIQRSEARPEERESRKPDDPAAAVEGQPDAKQAETEALKAAVAKRQAEERARLIESQQTELEELHTRLARETREKLKRFNVIQRDQAEARLHRQEEEAPKGLARFASAMQDTFSPDRAARREAERRQQDEEFARRQQQERDDYAAFLQRANQQEFDNLTKRHEQRLAEHVARGEEDLDRYIREQELARKLEAENEERERQLAEQRARDGPKRAR